jgi:hypothetical protein
LSTHCFWIARVSGEYGGNAQETHPAFLDSVEEKPKVCVGFDVVLCEGAE